MVIYCYKEARLPPQPKGKSVMSVSALMGREWKQFRESMKAVVTPEFLGQPWKLRDATVRRKTTIMFIRYLELTFDTYQDCQTIYPAWHVRRRIMVPVGRRLFQAAYNGLSLIILCQYSRYEQRGWHQPDKANVRVKIAH
jgi:hypothetical protein